MNTRLTKLLNKIYTAKDKGFTYIEVVIGVLILSYVALAFTAFFMNSTIAVKDSQFKTLAYQYAGDRVERIRATTYDLVVNDTETKQLITGKDFALTQTVAELTENELKQVDINVAWAVSGGTRSVSITTLVANYKE
ncbi:hypothetical protein ACFL4O_02565 [bacterium]